MGKGDRKTKRGKILKGTFGVRRPKKQKNLVSAIQNKKSKNKTETKSRKKG